MIITDKAKEALQEHLNKLNKDLLYIFMANSSCCGHAELQLSLEDAKDFDNEFELINGIKVLIEDDIKKDFENVTMEYDGESFMLKNLAISGHHHHEGECCCGEDCDCEGDDCCCEGGECDCDHEHGECYHHE